jgi:hypothetical protein
MSSKGLTGTHVPVDLSGFGWYGSSMPATDHVYFPYGMHCCHCDEWFPIRYVETHVLLVHPKCRVCLNEVEFSRGLLEELDATLDRVRTELHSAPSGGNGHH